MIERAHVNLSQIQSNNKTYEILPNLRNFTKILFEKHEFFGKFTEQLGMLLFRNSSWQEKLSAREVNGNNVKIGVATRFARLVRFANLHFLRILYKFSDLRKFAKRVAMRYEIRHFREYAHQNKVYNIYN